MTVYLIPSNPRVFNIKWDLDSTRYQVPAGVPALPPPPAAAAAVVTRLPFVVPAVQPARPPISKRPCRACSCSAKGITAAPQKRLGQLGQTAGVPAGTVLAYTASWKDGKAQINNPDAVQAQIQANLAQQYGIVIDSQAHSQSDYFNFTGTQSMTLQVHVTSDYGAAADIQSVIDGAIYAVTNKQFPQGMPGSTIRIVKAVSPSDGVSLTQQYPPATAAMLAAAQAGLSDAIARGDQVSAAQFQQQIANIQGTSGDPLSWLSKNWMWLLGGGIALVAVKELV